MEISYDYYRTFYYVAKYKNFTLAAHYLYSSQPNVTRAVRKLEQSLGCTLFTRSNRGTALTPEGEQLYAHVAKAFDHIHAGEEELAMKKGLQSGLVSLSVTETGLHCLMLPVLKAFHKAYPGIRIRLSNYSTPQALAALKAGLADIAVVTSPADVEKPITASVVKTYQEVAVCSPAFSHLVNRKVTLAEVAEHPVISLGSQTKSYAFYEDFFMQNGVLLRPEIEAATTDQILPMVQNDLGIGFVPEDFLKGSEDSVMVLDLQTPIPKRKIYVAWNTEHPLSLGAKKLKEEICGA